MHACISSLFFPPTKEKKNSSASRKAVHRAVARVVTVLQLKKDAFRQQKLPKAKHQNPEEGRMRGGESMRSDLTAVEQRVALLPSPAQEKDAAKGQKKARGRRTARRGADLVPWSRKRKPAPLRPAGDRDKAGVEGHTQ